ncbi:protein-tyrosine phosphatase-like protein [Crucibulum laeve]|uniref:protein-tyrosine-phosphatase n=1 Tax=Crucibulum laeve TaxID=68775 RepID=A0A5C3LJA9_9AGAR|nr:protein-tyrosine phosphatase-like protein [Crucibulum laeve]
MGFGAPSVNEIVKGEIYMGNLSAALSAEQRYQLGVTHIISVCPDYSSSNDHHLTISVDDTEYDDLLIHLPKACSFIEGALQCGGRVLVHCVMGISRSATVVAAYLMKSRNMDAATAIRYIKKRRPQVHPNYGFIKQLSTFAKCDYQPCLSHPAYRSWKRIQKQDVTNFLNKIVDTVSIIPDKLLLTSDFPNDAAQAESLLLDLGITHLLSLSPAEISSAVAASSTNHRHINIDDKTRESLLLALPKACKFIREAVDSGGLVLVHCLIESRACTVIGASLMSLRYCTPEQAFAVLEDALPLFSPTRNFSRHLELFYRCKHHPTRDHPMVREWLAAETGTACPQLKEKENSSPSSSSSKASPANATSKCTTQCRESVDLGKTAAQMLSETGIDLEAFGDALAKIQMDSMGLTANRTNRPLSAGIRPSG